MEFNYREYLLDSFKEKKGKNPHYSLRAFSRDLGISSTTLSDVLSGKRNFSKKNALLVSEKMAFSPNQYDAMMSSLKSHSLTVSDEQREYVQVKEDEFKLISNWYYMAILTLSKQKNVSASCSELALRLGITISQVKEALDALTRLNFINVKNNKLIRTTESLKTTTDIPSYAIKEYHSQNLELIRNSLYEVPVELREISSVNLNIDPKKIKKAKMMIDKFTDEFADEMEKTKAKEVYTLMLNFFPASLAKKERGCE